MPWNGRTVANAGLERNGKHVSHARDSSDIRLDGFRDRIVDRKDHDGIAARPVAADLHAGDIDVLLTQEGPDGADHAGSVGMPAHQEGAMRDKVDPKIVEGDDVRFV